MGRVIPNNTNKASNNLPDSYVGVELEFAPADKSQMDWRAVLHDHNISCWEVDGAGMDPNDEYGTHTRQSVDMLSQVIDPAPEYMINRLQQMTELVRHDGTPSSFIIDNRVEVGEEPLRAGGGGDSLGMALSPQFRAAIETRFPITEEMTDRSRWFWSLGTDPTAGLELRSPPLALQTDHASEVLSDACDALSNFGADITNNCGTHVHHDMTDRDARKIFLTYRLLEPLLVAAVEPGRYHDGYNTPVWTQAVITPRNIQNFRNEFERWSGHSTLLSTSSIMRQNTLEFRQLEGTIDHETLINWVNLTTRFVQCANDTKWSAKFRQVVPLGVCEKSVKAFLQFLDINRSSVCTELKQARDWYTERVAQYKETSAFRRALTTSSRCIISLEELYGEKTGLVGTIVQEDLVGTITNRDLGLRALSCMQNILTLVPGTVSNTMDTNFFGELSNVTEEDVEAQSDELSFGAWSTFVSAMQAYDLENIGVWFSRNIIDLDGDSGRIVLLDLTRVLRCWLSRWSDRAIASDTIYHILRTSLLGEAECVVF